MEERLRSLLLEVASGLQTDSPEPLLIVSRVRALMEELARPPNNTDENCRLVDEFVSMNILYDDSVEDVLARLPRPLAYLIQDIGMCLHDTHAAQQVARNFESTPEQLVARAAQLEEEYQKEKKRKRKKRRQEPF